jgi:hypothetical protein
MDNGDPKMFLHGMPFPICRRGILTGDWTVFVGRSRGIFGRRAADV